MINYAYFNGKKELLVKILLAHNHFLSEVSLCVVEHFEAKSYISVDIEPIK